MLAAYQLSAFAIATPAHACQCGVLPSATEALKDADLVFEGTTVERWPVLVEVDDRKIPTQRYTFHVLRIWKGDARKTVALAHTGGNCSYSFGDRKTYLVFAARFRDSYYTSTVCVPTKPILEAGRELAVLGPGAAIQPSFVPEPESAAHRFMRRVTAAALVGISWMRFVPMKFGGGEPGVWGSFTAVFALLGLGLMLLRLLPRQRWKLLFRIFVAALLVFSLALLAFGYRYAANHATLRALVE